jgi:hypothetical protein
MAKWKRHYGTENSTYWVQDLININCPFVCDVKEHIIFQYSFFASLLIPECSNPMKYTPEGKEKLKVENYNP